MCDKPIGRRHFEHRNFYWMLCVYHVDKLPSDSRIRLTAGWGSFCKLTILRIEVFRILGWVSSVALFATWGLSISKPTFFKNLSFDCFFFGSSRKYLIHSFSQCRVVGRIAQEATLDILRLNKCCIFHLNQLQTSWCCKSDYFWFHLILRVRGNGLIKMHWWYKHIMVFWEAYGTRVISSRNMLLKVGVPSDSSWKVSLQSTGSRSLALLT